MFLTNKAASKRWLTFSVLALLSITACEETNTVGVDFIQESAIQVDTVFIDQIDLIEIDPYLGQLSYSALGSFQDPLLEKSVALSISSLLSMPLAPTPCLII